MKILGAFVLSLLVIALISSCSTLRKENPLNVKCPACGYIWDRTPAEDY